MMKINKNSTTIKTWRTLYDMWKHYLDIMEPQYPGDDYPFSSNGWDGPSYTWNEYEENYSPAVLTNETIKFAEYIGYDLSDYNRRLEQSRTLIEKFKDPKERESQRKRIREHWENKGTKTGISVSQKDSYSDYMREYQKRYREAHPNYYRDFQRKKRERLKKQEIKDEDFFNAIMKMEDKND